LAPARDPRRSVLGAAARGASAAALWAVHGRMVTVVVLTAAIVAWLGIRRRLRPAVVAVVLVVLAAGAFGTHLLDAYLIDHNYGGHVPDEEGNRLSALAHLHALLTSAGNLFGQAWYLLVSTFGLAAVVVAAVLAPLRRSW